MQDDEPSTNAVSLKLPTSWVTQPHVWFTQAEAQFHIRRSTADDTIFYHVVAALDQDTAGRLLDVLTTPPETNKYAALKDRLLQTFGFTRRERAAKLLEIGGLGDRKPSALLDEMRSLAGGHTSCLLFEEVFLRAMPDGIRMQLAQQDFTNLDEVATHADALWQAKQQSFGAEGINKILKVPRPARSSPSCNSDMTTTDSNSFCFYHARFGANAKKCRKPCTYTGNGQAGRQ